MKITVLIILLIIVNGIVAGGGGGKHHVHFKIHVPDIIKHHIHTKTVFIHVHGGHGGTKKKKMIPKKKETHHEESHHEDWSSWSSYDSHGGHGNGHEDKHHGTKNVKTSGDGHTTHGALYGHSGPSAPGVYSQGYGYGNLHPHRFPHSEISSYGPRLQQFRNPRPHHSHSESIEGIPPHPVPPQQNILLPSAGDYNDPGLVGYSYPPQYGMQQDIIENLKEVTETPDNGIEPYSEIFEEGYRKGLHSQTGHVLSEELKNFYDNNFEAGDSSKNGHDYNDYKNYDDSINHAGGDHSSDHDGYNNYHDHDSDSYISAVMDTR